MEQRVAEVIAVSYFRRGKLHVPREIEKLLKLSDWDAVLWIKIGNKIYVRKAGRSEESKYGV